MIFYFTISYKEIEKLNITSKFKHDNIIRTLCDKVQFFFFFDYVAENLEILLP